MSARGIVIRMMSGRRMLLNWATSNSRMIMRPIGILAAIDWFAFTELSASP